MIKNAAVIAIDIYIYISTVLTLPKYGLFEDLKSQNQLNKKCLSEISQYEDFFMYHFIGQCTELYIL